MSYVVAGVELGALSEMLKRTELLIRQSPSTTPTPVFQPWSQVSAAYNRLIQQFQVACVMWGSSDWGPDPDRQPLPGSGGADTVGGFVNNCLKAFIGGDLSQANRIVNRANDLANSPRPTPDAMRQVASALVAQTNAIVKGIFDGTMVVGQESASGATPPSSTGGAGGGGGVTDYGSGGGGVIDYGSGGAGGGGEPTSTGLPGWVLSAAVIGAILLLRR